MRRFAPASSARTGLLFAGAGSASNGRRPRSAPAPPPRRPVAALATTPAAVVPIAANLPADFDAPAFERIAKLIFIRLQAANDVGDLNDLRAFTTPEMFACHQARLQDRGAAAQQTDVVRVDAEVLDVASDADRQLVSVRFHGLIREDAASAAGPFDEVWHLSGRPTVAANGRSPAFQPESAPALARTRPERAARTPPPIHMRSPRRAFAA